MAVRIQIQILELKKKTTKNRISWTDPACKDLQQIHREKSLRKFFSPCLLENLRVKYVLRNIDQLTSQLWIEKLQNLLFAMNCIIYFWLLYFHKLYYLPINWIMDIFFNVLGFFSTKKKTAKPKFLSIAVVKRTKTTHCSVLEWQLN